MSTKPLMLAVIGWPIAVLTALAMRIVLVSPALTVPEYASWLFLGCAPMAIALLMARRQPTRSIAHVIYDAEHAGAVQPPTSVEVRRG